MSKEFDSNTVNWDEEKETVRIPLPPEGGIRSVNIVTLGGKGYVFPLDITGEAIYNGTVCMRVWWGTFLAIHKKMKEMRYGKYENAEFYDRVMKEAGKSEELRGALESGEVSSGSENGEEAS